jgi:hypothetical protein
MMLMRPLSHVSSLLVALLMRQELSNARTEVTVHAVIDEQEHWSIYNYQFLDADLGFDCNHATMANKYVMNFRRG